jgi:hypothetical protein
MNAVAKRAGKEVTRPVGVLIPLIKEELRLGYGAGIEHCRSKSI